MTLRLFPYRFYGPPPKKKQWMGSISLLPMLFACHLFVERVLCNGKCLMRRWFSSMYGTKLWKYNVSVLGIAIATDSKLDNFAASTFTTLLMCSKFCLYKILSAAYRSSLKPDSFSFDDFHHCSGCLVWMDNCRCGVKGKPFAVSIETRAPGCLGYVGDCTTQLCRDWNDNTPLWARIPVKQPVYFFPCKKFPILLYMLRILFRCFFRKLFLPANQTWWNRGFRGPLLGDMNESHLTHTNTLGCTFNMFQRPLICRLSKVWKDSFIFTHYLGQWSD